MGRQRRPRGDRVLVHVTERDTDTEATPSFLGTTDLTPGLSFVTLCSHVFWQEVRGGVVVLPSLCSSAFGEERGERGWLLADSIGRLNPPSTKPNPILGESLPKSSISHSQSPRRGCRRKLQGVGVEKSRRGRRAQRAPCSRQVSGVAQSPQPAPGLRLPGSCPGAGQFPEFSSKLPLMSWPRGCPVRHEGGSCPITDVDAARSSLAGPRSPENMFYLGKRFFFLLFFNFFFEEGSCASCPCHQQAACGQWGARSRGTRREEQPRWDLATINQLFSHFRFRISQFWRYGLKRFIFFNRIPLIKSWLNSENTSAAGRWLQREGFYGVPPSDPAPGGLWIWIWTGEKRGC